jgi:uncharacterized OB-fold protein
MNMDKDDEFVKLYLDDDEKIELGEPDKLPKQPLMYGWICPRCGTVHSPFTIQCGCPPPTRTWTGTSTEEIINR